MRRTRARLALSTLCLVQLAALAGAQGIVQPFESGLRWIHPASLAETWIPTRVSFAGNGELVWVGTEGAHRRLLALDSSQVGVVQPAVTEDGASEAVYLLAVAAAERSDRLFSVAQYLEPDYQHRRTTLARHDLLAESAGQPFEAWSFSAEFTANGPARLAVDDHADVVALGVVFDGLSTVRIHHIDGDTGQATTLDDLAGDSLEALALSGNGRITAVSLGRRLVVLDEFGQHLHSEQLLGQAFDLALDEDGSRLIVGSPRRLRVYDFDGVSYQLAHEHVGAVNEVPTKVAVSSNGDTYAASWYLPLAVDHLRCEVFDGAAHTLLNQFQQAGVVGAPQNAPVDLRMTANGSRIAFASWGQGNTSPDVVLLERGVAQPLMELDLPGSPMGIDLDPAGRRIALVTKNLHANQVGTTGEVRLYDTGERDLELLQPARLGGTLSVDSVHSGAALALFLIGARSATPTDMPGMVGQLHLARTNRLRVYGRVADAEGRANLSLAIPAHPSMIGLAQSVQVANRVSGQIVFSETVLDPLIH